MEGYAELRTRMVDTQLRLRDISDPLVLEAMASVPRHEFVPDHLKRLAYQDGPLPIGHGQTISQPYIVALSLQLLELKPEFKVLEVGTGSGYEAAVLSKIVASVSSIELIPELGSNAQDILKKLKYHVLIRIGDGHQGWPEQAPFDAIVVSAAGTHIPEALKLQLKTGGRMVIPVESGPDQQLVLIHKQSEDYYSEVPVAPVRFVPLRRG